jgi:iron(III) transport system permease protein
VIIWLALLILGVFFLSPLGGLLSQFNFLSLHEILTAKSFLNSLKATLISSIVASATSIIFALIFSRQFAHYSWRGKRLQRLFLLIPYLIPNFILAVAYILAWNPTTGLLNPLFKFPFGLYGLFGMTALFSIAHMPVAFLIFEDKLRRIDSSLKEAAILSGASHHQVFFKVELPLLKLAILSAFGLCFALNISAFAIPAWIGAPSRIYVLTYKIYQSIQLGGLDGLPDAASYAGVLFILAAIPMCLTVLNRSQSRKYILISGKGSKLSEQKQASLNHFIFQAFFIVTQFLFWIAPLTCLLISTFVKPGCLQADGFNCLKNLSIGHYQYVLFQLPETQAALRGSLLYGGIASIIILIICVFTLSLLSKKQGILKLAEVIFSIPLATPGAIIALGLIVVYSGRFGVNLYNTAWIVVFAFVVKYTNLAFQPVKNGFGNISGSLIEAAKLSGAQSFAVWRKIIFPILKPEILGAFFLVFIPIIGELTMSIFLSSNAFRNIGTVLFDLQDYADQAAAGALSILLVCLVLFLNECAYRLSRGKLGY